MEDILEKLEKLKKLVAPNVKVAKKTTENTTE